MAQQCTEHSSLARCPSSAQLPSWWDFHHHACATPSLSSLWTTTTCGDSVWCHHHHYHLQQQQQQQQPQQQQYPSSNSSCEEDISMSTSSFTNASNHSGRTSVESSRCLIEPAPASSNELMGEHASDSQLWSHILLSVGSNGDIQNSTTQEVGENFLQELLPSKHINPTTIFESENDYLKKWDANNWDFTNSLSTTSFNNNNDDNDDNNSFEKHNLVDENHKLNRLSNLVSNWSIAPPAEPDVISRQFDPIKFDMSLGSYATDSTSSCYGPDIKLELIDRRHDSAIQAPPSTALYRSSVNNNNNNNLVGSCHVSLNSSLEGGNSKYYYTSLPDGGAAATRPSARNGLASSNRFNKALDHVGMPKTCFKSTSSSNCGKQTSNPGTVNEGKKKRSEDINSEVVLLKKPKQESSTISSSGKMQAPKVKLGDKITALQQIVSPFGKTDTASVLLEAIQYIKFLQEQVQMLSSTYMKTNPHNDPWAGLDRKDNGDAILDLRSRGLCLVPVSCTPQLYQDNTGSDYWTPTYRGYLYR